MGELDLAGIAQLSHMAGSQSSVHLRLCQTHRERRSPRAAPAVSGSWWWLGGGDTTPSPQPLPCFQGCGKLRSSTACWLLPQDGEVRLGHAIDSWLGFSEQQQCGVSLGTSEASWGARGLDNLSLTWTLIHWVSLGHSLSLGPVPSLALCLLPGTIFPFCVSTSNLILLC